MSFNPLELQDFNPPLRFVDNACEWIAAGPQTAVISVANLYRCRWQIEVFFKQIKQSLQLCDFPGNSAK
jgi:Transposase DDE domain